MSADFHSPPNGSDQPSSNGGEGEHAEFLPQKRRHRPDEDEQAEMETQDQQIAVLTSLLANLMRNKAPSEPPPPKKVYWFNKGKSAYNPGRPAPASGVKVSPPIAPATPAASGRDYTSYSDDTHEQPGGPEQPEAGPAAAIEPSHPPEVAPLGQVPAAPVDPDTALASQDPSFWRSPRELAPVRRFPGWGYWVLTFFVGLAAFLGGTRMPGSGEPVSHAAAVQNPLQAWSDLSLARLDGILEADQAGDLENAHKMGEALQTEAGPLPGMELYLNLLDARQRKLADAQSRFLKMAGAGVSGPELALIESALGFTYARQRRFSDASEVLQKAVVADPFSAESFRLLGESLRREGHFQQAVSALRQALLRYPAGAAGLPGVREYAQYKLRLAEIEGNLPVDARPAAAESGATGDSAGYGFLTDAAAALQQGKGDVAAEALQKAQAVLPACFFERLLSDYFFRAYQDVPQVSAFFPANPEPARQALSSQPVYFVDP